MIAPRYIGGQPDVADTLRDVALASDGATLSAGVGLRALSLVDIATWDLAARRHDLPIAALLGGEAYPMLATAIVGYPPSLDEDGVAAQVQTLRRAGWRRFKLPVGPTTAITVRRVRAADAAAAGGEVSLDAAWLYRDAAAVSRPHSEDECPTRLDRGCDASRRDRTTCRAPGDDGHRGGHGRRPGRTVLPRRAPRRRRHRHRPARCNVPRRSRAIYAREPTRRRGREAGRAAYVWTRPWTAPRP